MSTSKKRATTLAVVLATGLILLAPDDANAQRSTQRNLILNFSPGSATQNGYVDAQLEVSYWFQDCAEGVGFVAQYNPRPHMVVGAHRYYVDGKLVQVPPQFSPRDVERPTIKGTANGNGISKPISYLYASTSPSCWTNGLIIGSKSQFWPVKATDAERERILNQFGFHPSGSLPALRNMEVESHFRTLWADARRDSAQKVAAARRDSTQRATATRQDSIQRARMAQARRDSTARAEQQRTASANQRPSATSSTTGSATAASTPGGSTAAGSTATPSTGATASRETEAQRARRLRDAEAQRAREAEAERQREAEHARVVEAQRREQAIQDSIRIEQMAEATAQAAMIIGAGIGKVLEGLEGTGLALGANYSMPFQPHDGHRLGVTISGYMDGIVLPYFEISTAFGAQDVGLEKAGMAAHVGSVIPKTAFRMMGSPWQMHAGMMFVTTWEPIHEFNSLERTRKLLVLGITRKAQNIMRLETIIYSGTPRFGLSLAHAL